MTSRFYPRDRRTAFGVCLLIVLAGTAPGCGTDYEAEDQSGARSRAIGDDRSATTAIDRAGPVAPPASSPTVVVVPSIVEEDTGVTSPEGPAIPPTASIDIEPAENPHQAYREAEALYRQGDRQEAIPLLQASILARDDFAPAHFLLGLCQWKVGDLTAAEAALTAALEIEPRHLRARVNLGRVLVDDERGSEAVDVLRVAIDDGVESDGLWNVYGLAQMAQGELDSADAAFVRAIELAPDNLYPLNKLGVCRIRAGRFEDAVEPLLQAAEMDNPPAYVFNNLGLAMERIGQLSEARDALALAAERGHPHAPLSLARVDEQIEWLAATAPEPESDATATAVVEESAPADSLGASIGSEDTGFATEMEASLVGIPKTASDALGTAESEAP